MFTLFFVSSEHLLFLYTTRGSAEIGVPPENKTLKNTSLNLKYQ